MRYADEELHKITLNIFAEDYYWLLANAGHSGYNEKVRRIIREYIRGVERKGGDERD